MAHTEAYRHRTVQSITLPGRGTENNLLPLALSLGPTNNK